MSEAFSATQQGEPAVSTVRQWLAVAILGVGTFTIVSTEFAPMGLLSSIASNLGSRPANVGLIVMVYGWIGAGSALLSAVLPNHFPRKPLLVGLMLVLAASNGLAMISTTFPALMLARIVGAVSHGVFWAMVAALAMQITPPNRMGLATSVVFGGVSIASVLGVPLINLIGQAWGWRAAFGVLGALSLLTALLLGVVLPRLKTEGSVGLAALITVLRSRALWAVYIVSIFTISAHFGAFTFIEPYLRHVPGIAPAAIAALLLGFGAAGFASNILAGLLVDRFMRPVIVASLLLMCAALGGLGWFGPGLGMECVLALLIVWGAAISALFVGIQTWVLRVGGDAAIPASALYTTIFNSALGVGAMLGALTLDAVGLSGIMTSASVAVAIAVLIVATNSRSGHAS
jgi:predicted MFS family arabinose efflux permease